MQTKFLQKVIGAITPMAEIIGIDLAKDRCAKSNEDRVIEEKRLSGGFQFTSNEGHIC
jgi:hypothetical protein